MNRREFGQLVAALRKEHYNPIAGKVWSQKVFAEKTGLSEKVIGNIEQGHRVNLDSATLLKLAGALQLTRLECKGFMQLPSGFDEEMVPAEQIEAAREAFLDSFRDIMLPAFVHDSCYDIIMANRIWFKLFNLSDDFFATDAVANYNMLRLIFEPTSPVMEHFGPQRHTMSKNAIHCFRYLSLPHRHTEYFAQLTDDLAQYNTFRQAWLSAQHEEDEPVDHIRCMAAGEINCIVTTTAMYCSQIGDLHLAVFLPKNAATFDYFGTLARAVGSGTRALAPWPNPALAPPGDKV